MAYIIILLTLFCTTANAQESQAIAKFLEAAAIQTGIKDNVEQQAKDMYNKIIEPQYRPYFDAGLSVGEVLATRRVYIQKTWEF